jgi:hypothetical protein
MLVTYKNRRGKTYYLHEGRTKTGKPKYNFSLKNNGELVDEIPDGYEIYEHPGTGGVFLRKKLPQLILNIEAPHKNLWVKYYSLKNISK